MSHIDQQSVEEDSLTRQELLSELAEVLRLEAWRADFIDDRMPFVIYDIPESTVNKAAWWEKEGVPTQELVREREEAFLKAEHSGNYQEAYDCLIGRVDVILGSTLGPWEQDALVTAYSQAEEYAIVRGLPLAPLEGDGVINRKAEVETKQFIQGYEDPRESLVTLEACVVTMEPGEERDELVREIRRSRQWWYFSSHKSWGIAGPKPALPPPSEEVTVLVQQQRDQERRLARTYQPPEQGILFERE